MSAAPERLLSEDWRLRGSQDVAGETHAAEPSVPEPEPSAPEPAPPPEAPLEPAPEPAMPTATAGILRWGAGVVGGFMAVLLVWGGLMPLQSAVVMPGRLVPASGHQLVQHDDGGRILAILKRDGDAVEQGEVILRLDPVDRRAALAELEARRARLLAVRDNLRSARALAGGVSAPAPAPVWTLRGVAGPGGVAQLGGVAGPGGGTLTTAATAPPRAPLTRQIRRAQFDEFRAGRARAEREVAVLKAKGEALRRQRAGLRDQIAAHEKLRRLVREDIAKLEPLARRGVIAGRRVDRLRRSLAELDVRIEASRTDLRAKAAQGAEVTASVARAREGDREILAERLTRVLGELAETQGRIRAAREAVARTQVRAPVAGTLVHATRTTPGGVVAPGETVAEIVPARAPLVAEARARPDDIAGLAPGAAAEVLVTAHRGRDARPLPARVVYVAADATRDGGEGEPFYTVRLALAPGAVALQAGMQAEVTVAERERTFLAYLLEPFARSLSRAFRER